MAYSLFAGAGGTIPVGKLKINLGIYGSYVLNSVLNPGINQLMVYPGAYQSITFISSNNVLLVSRGEN
jgi:hypothetical protein